MPFCTNCGTDVSGAKFCSECGTPAVSQSSGAPPPQPAAESAPEAGGASPQQDAPGNSSSAWGGPESVSASTRNIAAALAYFTPVAVILLLIEPFKDIRYIRFHSLQSLFYFGAWIVLQFVIGLIAPPVAFVVSFAFIIGWFFIAYKAYLGEMFDLPVLGELVKKYL